MMKVPEMETAEDKCKDLDATEASIRIGIALTGALLSFIVTNDSIYPAIALINPWIREWATGFGIIVLIGLICIARRKPHLLHPRLFTAISLISVVGYFVLDIIGFSTANAMFLWIGSMLDSVAESWLFVMAYMSFAQLEASRRPLVAMVACFSAYLFQPVSIAIEPIVAVLVNGICFVVLFICVRPYAEKPLREVRASEPQDEMAIANPLSFLPSWHLLYISVLVFSIAQGLAISLPGPFNDVPALPITFVPLAAILLIYLLRSKMPNADGLFSLCALLIIAGMILQPSDKIVSSDIASISNTLIDAGASCFNLLLVLLVGSIAGRNKVTALPTAATMLALYWLGIGGGAVLGNSAMAFFGWTETALVWTGFASAMVFVTFCFVMLKNASFVEAIGAIQLPVMPEMRTELEPASMDKRCEAVAAQYSFTPRETEVLELLAQGRTVGIIREKLVISLNTARFHTKNIYVKLNVHSQQELIDLVEQFEL